MPKKADYEKEEKFVELYTSGDSVGNATLSAKKAGWGKSPAQMGAYLKKKLHKEIRMKNEENISGTAGKAITVLQNLLNSEQDSIKLNTSKLVLELANYNNQTININVDNFNEKSDTELLTELSILMKETPNLVQNSEFKDILAKLETKQPEKQAKTPQKPCVH